MNISRTLTPVALALLVTGGYAFAQTADKPATTPPTTPAPATTGPDNGASAGKGSAATKAPAAGTPSADSPFDYRSSEKISEDLSVSFPVDI